MRFAKHRERLLAFVGAITVFTTFIFNERIHEDVKQRLAALQDAADLSYGRSLDQSILSRLHSVRHDPLETPEQYTRERRALTAYEAYRRNVQSVDRDEDLYRIQVIQSGNWTELFKVVSRYRSELDEQLTRETDDRLQSMRDSEQIAGDALERARGASTNWFVDSTNRPTLSAFYKSFENPEKRDLAVDAATRMTMAVRDFGDAITLFKDSVIVEATTLQSNAERRAEITTQVSYGLYALGWGLGLIGQLLHTSDSSRE